MGILILDFLDALFFIGGGVLCRKIIYFLQRVKSIKTMQLTSSVSNVFNNNQLMVVSLAKTGGWPNRFG